MDDMEKIHSDNEDFMFGVAKRETDEPIIIEQSSEKGDTLEAKRLEIEREEKNKDRKEKRYYSAFNLIIGCLVILMVIYLFDAIVCTVKSDEPSSLTEGIIEIVKTLLFTLSGYLFARKENAD